MDERLLLDTYFVLAVINRNFGRAPPAFRALLDDETKQFSCSVASLWEIAIKVRLGKLQVASPIARLDETCRSFGIAILPTEPRHVLHDLDPVPATRDPGDRLLLAQAAIEDMKLVTIDRALASHPAVWSPPPPATPPPTAP